MRADGFRGADLCAGFLELRFQRGQVRGAGNDPWIVEQVIGLCEPELHVEHERLPVLVVLAADGFQGRGVGGRAIRRQGGTGRFRSSRRGCSGDRPSCVELFFHAQT